MSQWVEAFYGVPQSDAQRHVGPIIDVVIREFEQRPSDLNEMLATIDVTRLPVMLLLAIIRALCPVRKSLSNWPDLRDRIRSEFMRRNVDHTQLLQGL